MLNAKGDAHAERSTLFDGERLVFECGESIGLLKIDNNIRATFDLEKCEMRVGVIT